ncbi:Putative major facilitator superfamily, MFS transporter superfamily [Septoria linicola]|uniref:Major facilitator superfamily, MFS transporter superfamily n=1 Tax=Septoria linicola TaxID=215465 RepID=A0A9Q9AFY5_9PEZI|nr:putative major facilitator superfamily, MFS transporter superfamily [Septoria linicola]USW46809.1 Putative major facilitator superfamily, MFS transporter superfamily [Septoria linicola]
MADIRRRSEATSTTKIHHHESQLMDDGDEQSMNVSSNVNLKVEKRLRLKIDIRLCSIAAILCSLNLLDSGIISSASVTSMRDDLDLQGNRYSVSIFIFTISSIVFQLPSTIAVRKFGPRLFFPAITCAFGIVTLCTAWITNWRQMIALRVLLGACMSGIYPGLSYLIASWYPRREQQTRFAFLQSGQVTILATGSIVNWALNHLDSKAGLEGWRWMFLVQGLITIIIGIMARFWIVDFPELAHNTRWFLTEEEQKLAVDRIRRDRDDVEADTFTWAKVLVHAKDAKIYGFACMFFLVNIVATSLSYFLPIILTGMGLDENEAIILSAPPYYWSVVPVLISSVVSDKYSIRGPVIVFNSLCLVVGFCMTGFADHLAVRYIGTFLATGAYVSNYAAVTTYSQANVAGQWKRVFTAASITAMNGAGGIAGSFIVRQSEAPRYPTAVWISIGSHLLMIAFVVAFSVWFWIANRRQLAGKVYERTEGFRYTY